MVRLHVVQLVFMVVLAGAAFPRLAAAQCVIMPLDNRADHWPDVAFSGTVQRIQTVRAGEIVTFDVDRVYKGQVDQHVVVFNWQHPPVLEGIVTFELTKRYLVLAHRQNAEERTQFATPGEGTETLGLQGCDVYTFGQSSDAQNILRGAHGYSPRQSPRP